ncbi:alpha/beta fold hydrolase [Rhizobium leguminosarum]|uniref:alpha/beta fold hydrolase n=1 Tax=Rhizobium leguminosarum TaxID=384 RepID=UPI0009B8B720|nr:alpha/beta fold hydrolase [Rhizobium leguminosarum]
MAKQVLFIQGAGEGVHDGWDDKLVASLERELGETHAVRYPRMPGEDDPRYPAWKAALMGEFVSLEDLSILVGHSIGGTILIHALAEQPPKLRLGGIFLIAAPFIGEGGWPSDDIGDGKDLSKRLPPGIPVYLYHGGADDEHRPRSSLRQSHSSRRRPHARRKGSPARQRPERGRTRHSFPGLNRQPSQGAFEKPDRLSRPALDDALGFHPVNRVMMLGDAAIPTKQEIYHHAEAAVATFPAAFLHADQP